MTKPIIGRHKHLGELFIQKYERYLPTAFDGTLTILEKVNKIINYLNEVGALVNNAFDEWNEVMEWVMNDGLNESIIAKLDDMVADGTMDNIINHNVLKSRASITVDINSPTMENPDETDFWFEDLGASYSELP